MAIGGRTAILKVDILSEFNDKGFGRAQSRFAAFGKAALAAAAVVGGALVVGVGKSITAARDLEQSVGAIETVFGSAAGTIKKFGETAAQAAGLSQREYFELAAVTGAMLQNLGYDATQAAKVTNTLAQRAADLSAVFGNDVNQVLGAFNAALRGEFDPLEQVGIKINEATIKAEALARGLWDGTGAIDQNARAQAALGLIMDQSAYAAGQYARESDTLAGAQSRLSAAWENLMAEVGKVFLPAATNVVTWLNEEALPAIQRFVDRLPEIVEAGKATLSEFVDDIRDRLPPELGDKFDQFRAQWSEFFDGLETDTDTSANRLRDTVNQMIADTIAAWASALLAIGYVVLAVGAAMAGDWSAVWENLRLAANSGGDAVNSTINSWTGPLRAAFAGTFGAAGDAGVDRLYQSEVEAAAVAEATARGVGDAVEGQQSWLEQIFTAAGATSAAMRRALDRSAPLVKTASAGVVQGAAGAVLAAIPSLSAVFGRAGRDSTGKMKTETRYGLDRVVAEIRNKIGTAKYAASSVAYAIRSAFYGLGSQLYSVGYNAISSLVAGMRALAGYVVSTLRYIVQSAIYAAKRALGIASPSTVFMAIGEQVAAGMAAGITSGASRYVAPAVAGMVPAAASSTSLSGRSVGITVNGTANPQQVARDLSTMISGARIRTGYAGLAA